MKRRMDPNVRSCAIETIIEYAELGDDPYLLELVGFNAARRDVTDDQVFVAIVAVLPLLPDEHIELLMRHIAEVLVNAKREQVTS